MSDFLGFVWAWKTNKLRQGYQSSPEITQRPGKQWPKSYDLLKFKMYAWMQIGLYSTGQKHTLQPLFQTFVCIKWVMLTSVPAPPSPPTNPRKIKNSSSLICQMALRLFWQTKSSSVLRHGQFPQWALGNYKGHGGASNRNVIGFNGAVSQTVKKPFL